MRGVCSIVLHDDHMSVPQVQEVRTELVKRLNEELASGDAAGEGQKKPNEYDWDLKGKAAKGSQGAAAKIVKLATCAGALVPVPARPRPSPCCPARPCHAPTPRPARRRSDPSPSACTWRPSRPGTSCGVALVVVEAFTMGTERVRESLKPRYGV